VRKLNPDRSSGHRIPTAWEVAAGLSGILIYFFLLSHRGLRTYFNGDDVFNLIFLHGHWRWPWWKTAYEALVIFTPTYRPMGGAFYRVLYGIFGFHPVPFRLAFYALLVLNLGLFFRFALTLSRCREAALLSTLVFSFHAALSDLYFSTGTVYDVLCACFTLAAFGRYAGIRSSGRQLRAKDIFIFLLLYGAALASKEMAASLPFALLLYEVLLAPVSPRRFWRRALPALLAGAQTAAVLALKVPMLSEYENYHPVLSPGYVLNNVSRYVGLLVFREGPLAPAWLIGLVALASVICIAARRPVALFGLWYGFIALLPLLAVPGRDGFVLYLPLAGFALFCGEMLAATRQATQRLLPPTAARPLVSSFCRAGFFVLLATGLFVIHSRHFHDQSKDPWRDFTTVKETVRAMRASHPTLPPGTRLFFLDDPIPRNQYTLLFVIQAAYNDPSLSVERQKNYATPIDPADYAIFDYVVSIHDGTLQERRLPPIRPEDPAVPVTFMPGAVKSGQSIRMRVGNYSDAAVDIEYQTTYRFAKSNGIALRWANLDSNGIATIAFPRLQDPGITRITAVRTSGDVWRKASGGFAVQ
jgi:hypothetical protein